MSKTCSFIKAGAILGGTVRRTPDDKETRKVAPVSYTHLGWAAAGWAAAGLAMGGGIIRSLRIRMELTVNR